MLSAPEYLGETKFLSEVDRPWKTWHIWRYYDETGELTAIRFGISTDLLCAHSDFHRRDCITPLHRHLWSIAEEQLRESLIFDEADDDFEVIEPFDSNVVQRVRSKI